MPKFFVRADRNVIIITAYNLPITMRPYAHWKNLTNGVFETSICNDSMHDTLLEQLIHGLCMHVEKHEEECATVLEEVKYIESYLKENDLLMEIPSSSE